MRAALVIDHRVDFINDQRARSAQHFAAAFASQQDVKRLRCGDDNVRRLFRHRRAVFRRRVAGADERANFDSIDA